MLLTLDYVFEKYELNVSGVIHIGGHYGGELHEYKSHNIDNIVLFEPLSSNFSVLSDAVKNIEGNIITHQVALGNDNKKVIMNISDNEAQSSSILKPKVHLTAHPEVSFIGTEEVEMKKLDDYGYQDYNMLVIDVQGYELEVLKGGVKTLKNIDYIFCEVNRDEVYEGNAKIEEVDDFLLKHGFERVEVEWYYSQVFGDAFYIKNKNMKKDISIICACKNRYNALKISLTSWLMFEEVKEIIIVDWSSDEPIDDLLELDDRIKVIRVNDKQHFNLSQPLNLAASMATGKYIFKVDCDYIINPYWNFFESYKVDEHSFLSGNPDGFECREYTDENGRNCIDYTSMTTSEIFQYYDSYSHFFKYLKGLLFVTKENFLKVGGFNENIRSYGWEDGEMIQKLENLGLEHRKINFDYRIMHIPHDDRKRFEHSQDYTIEDEEYFKSFMQYECSPESLPFQIDYALVLHYTEKNKEFVLSNSQKQQTNTEWDINLIKENHYLANEIKKELDKSKLEYFPSVHYITLEESIERQNELENQFKKYDIVPIPIVSKRFTDSVDKVVGKHLHQLNDGTKGCCVSHLKAIKTWYENTDEDYGFFCEDDLSLDTVPFWNFDWKTFVESLPEDAECVQLFTIRDEYETFEIRERYWNDWGVTAYILTRDYAKKIIDTYIKDDEYVLEIPNQDIMPLIENILFTSLGKTYTIPLFVENTKFNSTFVGYDDDVKDGHKTNHIIARQIVLNYWKNSLNELKVIKTELENLLTKYSLDTENAEYNFDLGVWYENEGHTAPALSYFLRCAERSEDTDLAYEALIRGHYCYEKQGERHGSSRSLLWQAQAFRPDRPEAHFLLSRYAEKRQWWQDAYVGADLALRYCDFEQKPLRTDVQYYGKYCLLFEKAVSGWWWGKTEESKTIMANILKEYEVNDNYKNCINENLKKMGVEE